jgi:hypothetical protein
MGNAGYGVAEAPHSAKMLADKRKRRPLGRRVDFSLGGPGRRRPDGPPSEPNRQLISILWFFSGNERMRCPVALK